MDMVDLTIVLYDGLMASEIFVTAVSRFNRVDKLRLNLSANMFVTAVSHFNTADKLGLAFYTNELVMCCTS